MTKKTSIAVMQPYFFPYIGYWQLINSVDKFVIYDDVNFIKGGYINRNKILSNHNTQHINLIAKGASPNRLIKDIELNKQLPWKKKLLKSLQQNYQKAPFFLKVYPILEETINQEEISLSKYLAFSIEKVVNYLNINTQIIPSSTIYNNNHLNRQDRLLEICKKENAAQYINSIGGQTLYSKDDFVKNGINLNFLKTHPIRYKQYKDDFEPNLSIIDVMMFNDIEVIHKLLNEYTLI